MDDLDDCQQKLRDAKDALRIVVWAGRQLVRETGVRVFPARRQSIELLAEALRDPRIRELLG
jgi:hypothetical protein